MSLLSAMILTYKAGKLSEEKLKQLQQKRLAKLVKYARKNSPFYQKLYEGIGDDFVLSDLPPVSKAAMMADFDHVLTDQKITMKRIEEFTSDLENIGRMIDRKYLVFRTSGSTGIPAVVLYDHFNIDVASAVAAFRTFARKADYRAFMKHSKKTAGVFADYGFYLACGMSRYLQLKMPWSKTKININVNDPEEEIIEKLNAFQPAMLSGYPSNLALLAEHKDLKIHPDVVITGGEHLSDSVRKKLSDKFGCYVQTHYSCTEAGEIACECSEGHLHINSDWVIVEPVDENHEPVGFGVQSDKVLITNLSNYIQPFIRYELTDRIVVHNEPCSCGRKTYWLEIEGRTDDILIFDDGVKIAPMSLYKILEEVPHVQRFQLVSRSRNTLELRLSTEDRQAAFAAAENALQEYFHSLGLKDIRIERSEELPHADEKSGKFRHIYADHVQELSR